MGSGIAAQIANAGLPVLLYDLDAPHDVIKAMKSAGSKGALMHESRADLITPLSLQTDLDQLSDVDWICEVIVENLGIKQDLYAKIEQYCKSNCIISSNTSTIPLEQLVQKQSDNFKKHFLITHFFNPPRHMRLLELVTSPDTRADVTSSMRNFLERVLGKSIVPCNDRPGFIANRLGVYWMMNSLDKAIKYDIDSAAADKILAKDYGLPKTGLFGLMDLIGLDLMPKMAQSLADNLPKNDPFQLVATPPPLLIDMIETGFTGRKGKGGFTRMIKQDDGRKEFLTLNLGQKFDIDKSYKNADNTGDAKAWATEIMDDMIAYAKILLNDVSDKKGDIDAAMIWGYNWEKGPFAMAGDTIALPKLDDASFVRDFNHEIIKENDHARLCDMGDRTSVLSFKTKMNVFDNGVFDLLEYALTYDHDGLVIATDATHFSAGANINRFLDPANNQDWQGLSDFIKRGQIIMQAVSKAPIPVITALNGFVMGGACELALHSTHRMAYAETNIGLVEPRVGLVPGWGGCVGAFKRFGAPEALQNILAQWTSASALDAKKKGYLSDTDPIVMHRDLLLSRAKMLTQRSDLPEPLPFEAPNKSDIISMSNWLDEHYEESTHDRLIGEHLIAILSSQTEEDMWQAEHDAFITLMKTDETKARIEKILHR